MNADKLSVSLHAVLDDMSGSWETSALAAQEAPDIDAFIEPEAMYFRAALITMTPTPTPSLRVFVRCPPDADLSDFTASGVEFDRNVGASRAASVPIEALDALSDDDRVQRISASTVLRPHLDAAGPATRLPAYVQRTGRTGAGVIVGVVDTGIDAQHPAFAGRILRVWDQTVPGPGVAGSKYGVELTGSGVAGCTDEGGHGTHVAGIAAGADATFPGIAPGADLVIVKTTFDSARVASGVAYIFQVAEELGRPAVVNLSLGAHNDPHDGTDDLSVAVDNSTGPGRIVCVSAGNEGQSAIHAELAVAQGTTDAIGIEIDPDSPERVWLNVWYPGDDVLEFRVTSPAGDATGWQGPLAGRGARTTRLIDGVVQIASPAGTPLDPGRNVLVELRPPPGNARVEPGGWSVELQGTSVASGAVHAWLMDKPDVGQPSHLVGHISDAYKVGTPGAANDAITVAAWVSKAGWTDASGQSWGLGEVQGSLATFTSPGPRRDGAPKPDVAAPGSMIVSARSSQHTAAPEFVIDADHLAMQGTSMSCPFVTGLVALLLEGNPNLTPADAKVQLQAAATIPYLPPGSWDAHWGAGLIDADSL